MDYAQILGPGAATGTVAGGYMVGTGDPIWVVLGAVLITAGVVTVAVSKLRQRKDTVLATSEL